MSSLVRTAVIVMLALSAAQATADAQARPREDRDRLTADDIRARPTSTVYDLIRSKRPSWLSVRGSATLRTRTTQDPFSDRPAPITVGVEPLIIVYVDNMRRGSHEMLRSMSTEDIDSIERLDAMTATQRFGTGHEHGAILIRSRVR